MARRPSPIPYQTLSNHQGSLAFDSRASCNNIPSTGKVLKKLKMRVGGIEPPRPFGRQFLKLLRLPSYAIPAYSIYQLYHFVTGCQVRIKVSHFLHMIG